MNKTFLQWRGWLEMAVLIGVAVVPAPPGLGGTEYYYTTLAGRAGGPGNADGTGSAARFFRPSGLAVDSADNVYVADRENHTIRRVTPSGEVTTLAGLAGNWGITDGRGSAARFWHPAGVAVDRAGNVYVADYGNSTIRKVTPAGVATTLAGLAGRSGSTDAGGSAARFFGPSGVAVDNAGNVYVADSENHTIRKVTPTGEVTTLAGLAGSWGSVDGPGNMARFCMPNGAAVDSAGNLYVADSWNHTIRRITPAGEVTTLAGMVGSAGQADGVGNAARFWEPSGVVVDNAGNVHVTDVQNHTIRKITPDGMVTTLAGMAENYGNADGPPATARFCYPFGLAMDSAGYLYVGDSGNHTLRKITPSGGVTTLAGLAKSSGYDDGTGSAAWFYQPSGVAADNGGQIYVVDTGNHTIRKITPAGMVTTLAGLARSSGYGDGTGTLARFYHPSGVAADSAGNVYVADWENHAIRKITSAGLVTTLAGMAGNAGSRDGIGSGARFYYPKGVALDGAGNLYVADYWNHTIRKATPAGEVTTLAGLAGSSGSADGTGSAVRFSHPSGVAVDSTGNVYVADTDNSTIRKVSPLGVVTTLAGMAGSSGSADGTGSAARFSHPSGVTVDSAGYLYVADSGNHTIRKTTPAGLVTTIGGWDGQAAHVDGAGPLARFNGPIGIACDWAGRLYLSDAENVISVGQPGTGSTVPLLTRQPQSQTNVVGTTVNLSVAASGGEPLSYQWFKNGFAVLNGTNSAFPFQPLVLDHAGNYFVVVSNEYGVITSQVATLRVMDLGRGFSDDFDPAIDLPQWGALGGTLGSTLLTTNYGGSVSGPNSLWFGDAGSRFATTRPLSVSAGGIISFALRWGQGNSPWESVDLPAEGIVLEYSTDEGSTWQEIGRYDTTDCYDWTSFAVDIPAAVQGPAVQFRWRQTSHSGMGCDHWALDDVFIGIIPFPPAITAPPQSQTNRVGTTVNLQVAATGAEPLFYQWLKNYSVLLNATNPVLSLQPLALGDAGNYFVVVRNADGVVTSAVVVLAVQSGQAPTTEWVAFNDHAPGAGTHPYCTRLTVPAAGGTSCGWLKDIATGADLPVTLAITAAPGVTLAGVQGEAAVGSPGFNTFNGYVDFQGAPNPAVEITLTATVTYQFAGLDPTKRYRFNGTAVGGNPAYGNRWSLLEIQGADSFSNAHTANAVTTEMVPTLAASQVAINTGINNTTATGDMAVWENIDPGADGLIQVVCSQYTGATNAAGQTASGAATGYAITGLRLEQISLGLLAPPTIAAHPASVSVVEGQPATFHVMAAGSLPLLYFWLKDHNSVPVATNNPYTLSPCLAADAGSYQVVVSNAAGTAISTAATLETIPFAITNQPQGTTVWEGVTVSFTANANAPATFQWYNHPANPQAVIGASNNVLRFSPATAADAGDYFAVIHYQGMNYTSSVAHLTVNADRTPPRIVRALGLLATNPPPTVAVDYNNLRFILVSFDEPLSPPTVLPDYFEVFATDNPMDVLLVVGAQLFEQTNVLIQTTARHFNTNYTLRVHGIADILGNVMLPYTSTGMWHELPLIWPNHPAGSNDYWLFNESGANLGNVWMQVQYPEENAAPWYGSGGPWSVFGQYYGEMLFVGKRGSIPVWLPETLGSLLTPPTQDPATYVITYYFRKHFAFPGNSDSAGAELRLRYVVDDGAAFYLNGQELWAWHMPQTRPFLHTDKATATEGNFPRYWPENTAYTNLPYQPTLVIENTNLCSGDNVMAVEVHQGGTGYSTDMFFGMILTALVPPYGTIIPPRIAAGPTPAAVSAFAGTNIHIHVTAVGTTNLVYQWYKNGLLVTGQNSRDLLLSNVSSDDSGSYVLVVSNRAGVVTSSVVAVTVNGPPVIANQPQCQAVIVGSNAVFEVIPIGAEPLFFQWFKNGTAISNATNSAFRLQPLAWGDAGNYFVVVSNAYGVVTSVVAVLIVARDDFQLLNPAWQNNVFRVSVPTMLGHPYVLMYRTNLVGAPWTALPAVTGNGAVMILRDTNAVGRHRAYQMERQ